MAWSEQPPASPSRVEWYPPALGLLLRELAPRRARRQAALGQSPALVVSIELAQRFASAAGQATSPSSQGRRPEPSRWQAHLAPSHPEGRTRGRWRQSQERVLASAEQQPLNNGDDVRCSPFAPKCRENRAVRLRMASPYTASATIPPARGKSRRFSWPYRRKCRRPPSNLPCRRARPPWPNRSASEARVCALAQCPRSRRAD